MLSAYRFMLTSSCQLNVIPSRIGRTLTDYSGIVVLQGGDSGKIRNIC